MPAISCGLGISWEIPKNFLGNSVEVLLEFSSQLLLVWLLEKLCHACPDARRRSNLKTTIRVFRVDRDVAEIHHNLAKFLVVGETSPVFEMLLLLFLSFKQTSIRVRNLRRSSVQLVSHRQRNQAKGALDPRLRTGTPARTQTPT